MIAKFLEVSSLYKSSDQSDESCDLEGKIFEALETVKDTSIPEFRKAFNVMLAHTKTLTTPCYEEFKTFIRHMAITDDTWKLWVQFVFVDAMAYVGLFLSIRSGDWHLRMGSMKNMAPVFTAFDHPIYQKLISNHISDLVCMPQPVLLMFEQGAFVVSIGGREWHSVAIDEAHEMLINKQCKMSITKPSPDYINRVAKYITYRTKALHRFMQQLSPPEMKKSKVTKAWEVYFSSKSEKIHQKNVSAQIQAINNSSLLEVTQHNRGLINPFTDKTASTQQSHDLLDFRHIGQQEFLLRISYFILKVPSVKAPNRRKALQTFSVKQARKRRISQLERDQQLVISAMMEISARQAASA